MVADNPGVRKKVLQAYTYSPPPPPPPPRPSPLNRHSPLWTVAPNIIVPHSQRSLNIACLLFPLHLSPLESGLSTFHAVFSSLFLPLQVFQIALAFFGFAFIQHDLTSLGQGLYKLNGNFAFCMYLSPCLLLLSSLFLLLRVHIFSLQSSFQIF